MQVEDMCPDRLKVHMLIEGKHQHVQCSVCVFGPKYYPKCQNSTVEHFHIKGGKT